MSAESVRSQFALFALGVSLAVTLAPDQASAQFFEQIFGRRSQPQPRYQQQQYPQAYPDQNGRVYYVDQYGRAYYPAQQAAPRYQQPQPQAQRRQAPRRQQQQPRQQIPQGFLGAEPEQEQELVPGGQAQTGGTDKDRAIREFRQQPEQFMPMYVTRTEWKNAHEDQFAEFVRKLGQAVKAKKCGSVKSCMRKPEANIFLQKNPDPPGLVLYSDCADFPYFLRAYFAYKMQLPFSMVTKISMSQRPYASPANRDADLATTRLDNSPYGNVVEGRGRSNVARSAGKEPNFIKYIEGIFDTVSTRTLRVGPLAPGYDQADIYPVKLDRNGIRPGTVVHSTGHAYIVYDVDHKGTIHMIDAHPDGSITAKIVKPSTLERSRPDQGLGFFRFRPLRLYGAKPGANGALYGGEITPATSAELFAFGEFSLEQYFGPGSNVGPTEKVAPEAYQNAFKKPSFFEYLERQMRPKGVSITADEEVSDLMQSLCDEMQQRVEDVDLALTKKGNLNRHPHPAALPENIYATTGEWEDYSSPSRDSRMKAAVADIIKVAVAKFKQAKSTENNGTVFNGSPQDYVQALRGRLAEMDNKCVVTYTKSNGAKVSLRFTQVIARLNKLSFDPYHCAERRWGASGKELATCHDRDINGEWYESQQFMRNTVGKTDANERLIIRSNQPITLRMLQNDSFVDQPGTSPINLGTRVLPIMNLDEAFLSEGFMDRLTN